MKKILLLGDSIRISYEPFVKEKLEGTANVSGPEENCSFAKYTLWYLRYWFERHGMPDIIHWNNGIWDVFHLSEDSGIFTSPGEYVDTLRRIIVELRKTDAQIIWATTTAINAGCKHVKQDELELYNAEALQLMHEYRIPVNDLYAVVSRNKAQFIGADHLHLTMKGREACADAVVAAVKPFL